MIGTFLSVMDATVVNVARPNMTGSFGEDLLTITWVSTACSIAEIIMITMSSWWTAVLGRKRLFLASMSLFTVGSILAGTSKTFTQMIFYRVLQGFGGGSLMPCSQAIARETFPPAEQGMAIAIFSMGVVLAPATGPVLGGWLVDNYGWQWVFYINVPFLHRRTVDDECVRTRSSPPQAGRGAKRLDRNRPAHSRLDCDASRSRARGGSGLVLQQLDRVRHDGRWRRSARIAGVGALRRRARYQLSTLSQRAAQRRVGAWHGGGLRALRSSFLIPQFTETLLNYPAFQAGMVLRPRAVTMRLVMPLVGRLYNRISPRILIRIGIIALIVGYHQLSHFTLYVEFFSFLPMLVLMGLGMGAAMVTMSTVSLSTMPRGQMTGTCGLYTLSRRISGNVAYAMRATLLARRTQEHRSDLVDDVRRTNPLFRSKAAQFRGFLGSRRIVPSASQLPDLAMLDQMVNRQATMMSYNDCFWLMTVMLAAILPFLFLFPKEGVPQATEAAVE
jgi:MFS transporter, DHA2 family, multidrug resistance protein